MMTFRNFALASDLIDERRRVRRLVADERCGVKSIGAFLNEDAIAAVLPAHRKWLQDRLTFIDDALTDLGVDVASPVAWRESDGTERELG